MPGRHEEPPFRWVSFVLGMALGFAIGMAFCVIVAWATLMYIAEHQPAVPTGHRTPHVVP